MATEAVTRKNGVHSKHAQEFSDDEAPLTSEEKRLLKESILHMKQGKTLSGDKLRKKLGL